MNVLCERRARGAMHTAAAMCVLRWWWQIDCSEPPCGGLSCGQVTSQLAAWHCGLPRAIREHTQQASVVVIHGALWRILVHLTTNTIGLGGLTASGAAPKFIRHNMKTIRGIQKARALGHKYHKLNFNILFSEAHFQYFPVKTQLVCVRLLNFDVAASNT